MKEVEVLVKLKEPLKEVQKKINGLDFKGAKKTLDIYFYDPKRKNLKPDKKLNLDEVCRLREKEGQGYLAYKINHYDAQNKWIYSDEHEVKVSNFNSTLKILNHLGLKELTKIDNTKFTYLTDRYEIVLEDVKDLGEFMEVEALNVPDGADIEKVKEGIREYIKSLGCDFEELHHGKPELALKLGKVKNS